MTTRTRSAKSGKYVSRKQAKRRPATTVSEKVEKVLWRGWLIAWNDKTPMLPIDLFGSRNGANDEIALTLSADLHVKVKPIRVKIVEA